jgi:hypothetical protein
VSTGDLTVSDPDCSCVGVIVQVWWLEWQWRRCCRQESAASLEPLCSRVQFEIGSDDARGLLVLVLPPKLSREDRPDDVHNG